MGVGRPQGYDKDHRDIELLRLRSFTIGKKLDDSEVVGAGGLQRIADLISCMVPFVSSLRTASLDGRESITGLSKGWLLRRQARRAFPHKQAVTSLTTHSWSHLFRPGKPDGGLRICYLSLFAVCRGGRG